ncbi:MAG TPA: sugar phosphate isomerase/epimerase [Baekduia sp.]|uniref:sugar phosphate isomerase/epimerase family protein n=1 Tax=Baekduia sp. TaxID=2600305 RepID=UPI002D79966A|nr:sugar phosphate isomerase/epimerase [Baekduia sp.]HET6506839.1 sugar phosphate isomerase/epimerase [Baekduia sp.]
MTIELGTRLGLNVHRDQWPTAALLDSYGSAGFAWVQVHTPPRPMLADRERGRRHARALRAALAPHGLRLLLHGPDDLSAGTIEHDRAFDGLMDYAAEAGAELVGVGAMSFPVAEGPAAARRLDERLAAEERSLRRLAQRAEALGLVLALENLAPTYPSRSARVCHDVLAVRDLVRRLGSPAVGVLLDVGHAHLVASLRGESAERVVRDALDDVVVFHVHDNLGARRHDLGAPGVDPLRLDLHLPPGAGCLPWDRLGPLLAGHGAPLMLEVERSHGAAPAALAADTTALLRRRPAAVPAAA